MRTAITTLVCCLVSLNNLNAQPGKVALKHDITRDLFVNTSLYRDLSFKHSFLSTINIGMSFYPHDRFAVAPDVSIYKFWNPQYSSLGIGIGPAIRTYPIRRDKFALFTEFKGAVVFMFPEYRFQSRNFTFTTTLGADMIISARVLLRSAIGYHHFSNARHYDHNYNSASDALGGYIGIVHKLK